MGRPLALGVVPRATRRHWDNVYMFFSIRMRVFLCIYVCVYIHICAHMHIRVRVQAAKQLCHNKTLFSSVYLSTQVYVDGKYVC